VVELVLLALVALEGTASRASQSSLG